MTNKNADQSAKESRTTSQTAITEQKIDEIFARARQAVKPIINREAANEIVSDDLLNFRMKTTSGSNKKIE
jgi:hypothetical protein